MKNRLFVLIACVLAIAAHAQPITVTVDAANPGKPISPDLMGIFFEDLNYAADGGLYAELIQNRSFEYNVIEQRTWNQLSFWDVTTRGNGRGSLAIETGQPVHPNNPHYAVLEVNQPGDGVGIVNPGFDGIVVKAGESYNVSLFARQMYIGTRWGGTYSGATPPLSARLESTNGQTLGEVTLGSPGWEWTKLTGTITATQNDNTARFVVSSTNRGGIGFDMISLFPQKTFHNRPNGLRADLAQIIADLKPKFVRFPGGCLAHGNGLHNMYRWKNTIGPIEQRKAQPNLWGYHQTMGLGYYEYFQFCEDIDAKPLPVVPAGVCCQNSDRTGEHGQKGLPLNLMPDYIQELLDLIEWANGPATSTWGAKRAAAGHPESFNLKYLGVGNEDSITPVFKERFKMINDAIKKAHPEIVVIGTSGPRPDGEDFENGWKFANEHRIAMVDEHYYQPPQWFWNNLNRYDTYDRTKSKVYLGEYAAHDDRRRTTLRSAIAEAAYLTTLERNGDIVTLASYAPLLAKRDRTQWNPDMIYFSNTEIAPTINYYVQQLFSVHSGDSYLATTVANGTNLVASSVRDGKTGDLILKVVNGSKDNLPVAIKLSGAGNVATEATKIVLANPDHMVVNDFANPRTVLPQTSAITVGESFNYESPANSLTVIRIKTR